MDGTWQQPDHAQVVEELKLVRASGITRVRRQTLPILESIARRLYPKLEVGRGIESVLRDALAELPEGENSDFAAISFGLQSGLRGTRSSELRRMAADQRGVLPDTYRKTIEPEIFGDLSAGVLALFSGAAQQCLDDPMTNLRVDAVQQEYQGELLTTPEHDGAHRRHFVDPISMYPFMVERAEGLAPAERSLDVLGMTLYTAWTTLKFWALRPDTTGWTVRLAAVLDLESCMTRWIPERWLREAEFYLTDVVETARLPDVLARHNSLKAYAYDFVPTVHGYRLGNQDIFISFLKWQDDGRLGMRGYTYEFIPGHERSISAIAFRALYDSWFERAIARGPFLPSAMHHRLEP